MKDLIEALTIALKYGNPSFPTHCEHDVMYLILDPNEVSIEDKVNEEDGETFYSYRFGSA